MELKVAGMPVAPNEKPPHILQCMLVYGYITCSSLSKATCKEQDIAPFLFDAALFELLEVKSACLGRPHPIFSSRHLASYLLLKVEGEAASKPVANLTTGL